MAALIMAGMTAAAVAQQSPAPAPPQVHVRGKFVSLEGNVLTVGAVYGPATTAVTMTPDFRVRYIVASSLSAIKAGSFIGTAAIPQRDGTLRAIGVTVFPPGVTTRSFTGPFDLTPTSTMTNGTVDDIGSTKVDNVAAGVLTVTYDGGEKHVVVTPDTPVVTIADADRSALVPGARVTITATKDADGTLHAANVGVGKDCLVPPY
jgi:hypothetical protein